MTTVTINQADVEDVKALLGELKGKYKTVMTTAINKTLVTANTQAAARIGNKVTLKAARIKQDLSIKKANFSDISGSLSSLDASKNRVGLIQYAANPVATGVSVQVQRSSPRTVLRHAFIARGKNSATEHVFWRKNRVSGSGKWPMGKKTTVNWANIPKHYRIPLTRRVGPSVAYWFSKPDVFDPVSTQAQHVYLQHVTDSIDDILRRHRG